MHRDPQPVKLYTVAPMYRYAAPQKGRYREHWQCSVEAIGSADPALDAEVIQLYTEFARRVGITEYELQLNSIGDENCRPAYVERLSAWLDEHAEELDEEARAQLEVENEGVNAEPKAIEVFFALDGVPLERIVAVMAELRRSGLAADMDYAGRSLKGQMTQAGRSGARTVVIVRAGDATIRR